MKFFFLGKVVSIFNVLSIGLLGLSSLTALAAPEAKKTLTVYTYSALTSEWGPGALLRAMFEKECNCELKYVAVDDGAALFKRIKLEGNKTKAEVALGFDSSIAADVVASKLFVDSEVTLPQNLVAPVAESLRAQLVPFDYGWLAVMYDSQKIKMPPKDMDDLLSRPEFAKQLLLEDPRTSAPGLAFLVWLDELYASKLPEQLQKLRKQTLTVSSGWTAAYGLFTKGEAPMVISYTSSELYHRVVEKKERYKAALFPAHYAVTEFGAVVKAGNQKDLARKFLKFLLAPQSQKILAEKNWMYPALNVRAIPGLNDAFVNSVQPAKALTAKAELETQKRLVNVWLNAFR